MSQTAALKAELADVSAKTDVGFDTGGAVVETIKRLAAALEAERYLSDHE